MGGGGQRGDWWRKKRQKAAANLLATKIALHKYSSLLTSDNSLDPGTGTKREQRGVEETDIYFSMSELMVGCIIM